MRITNFSFFLLLMLGLLALCPSNSSAQSNSRCYQVDIDDIPAIVDSIEHRYGFRIQISLEDVHDFLTEQLTAFERTTNFPPPEPYSTGNFSTDALFRWESVLGQSEDYKSVALSLEVKNQREELPLTKLPGVVFPFHNGTALNLWLYSFYTVHDNMQSILNIIIIDKDVSFDCDPIIPSSRKKQANKDIGNATSFSSTVTPNPFDDQTSLQFELPTEGLVAVQIYDLMGQLVKTPLSQNLLAAGQHQVNFNSNDLAAGSYICRVNWDGKIRSTMMIKIQD